MLTYGRFGTKRCLWTAFHVCFRVRKDNLTSCNSGVNMEDVDCAAGGSSSLSNNRPSSVTSNSLSMYQQRARTSHSHRRHNAGRRKTPLFCFFALHSKKIYWLTLKVKHGPSCLQLDVSECLWLAVVTLKSDLQVFSNSMFLSAPDVLYEIC